MNIGSAALSGLNASALAMAVSANNVANLNTEGFQAKRLDLEDQSQGGVRPAALRESQEPSTPGTSNVDPAVEFTGQMAQSLAYRADLKMLETQQEILGQALDLKA